MKTTMKIIKYIKFGEKKKTSMKFARPIATLKERPNTN